MCERWPRAVRVHKLYHPLPDDASKLLVFPFFSPFGIRVGQNPGNYGPSNFLSYKKLLVPEGGIFCPRLSYKIGMTTLL
jgi:hypothetical protein